MSKIKKISKNLIGTTKTFENGCLELGIALSNLSFSDLFKFDNTLFKCDYCGFWCSVDEKHELIGDPICSDCLELEVHQD